MKLPDCISAGVRRLARAVAASALFTGGWVLAGMVHWRFIADHTHDGMGAIVMLLFLVTAFIMLTLVSVCIPALCGIGLLRRRWLYALWGAGWYALFWTAVSFAPQPALGGATLPGMLLVWACPVVVAFLAVRIIDAIIPSWWREAISRRDCRAAVPAGMPGGPMPPAETAWRQAMPWLLRLGYLLFCLTAGGVVILLLVSCVHPLGEVPPGYPIFFSIEAGVLLVLMFGVVAVSEVVLFGVRRGWRLARLTGGGLVGGWVLYSLLCVWLLSDTANHHLRYDVIPRLRAAMAQPMVPDGKQHAADKLMHSSRKMTDWKQCRCR